MLAEEALDERSEDFAGFGQNKGLVGFGPVELEAGGLGGDPDLSNGCVGCEDELSWTIFEEDIEYAILLFGLEAAVFLDEDQGLLEGGEGLVGFATEGGFVDGGHSGDSLRQLGWLAGPPTFEAAGVLSG